MASCLNCLSECLLHNVTREAMKRHSYTKFQPFPRPLRKACPGEGREGEGPYPCMYIHRLCVHVSMYVHMCMLVCVFACIGMYTCMYVHGCMYVGIGLERNSERG